MALLHPTVRVFIAFANPYSLDGLAFHLGLISPLQVTGTASRGQDLPALLAANPPQLLVLDSRYHGNDTPALCRQLADAFPDMHLLVLHHQERPLFLQTLMASGIRGMLHFDTPAQEIADALLCLQAGGTEFGPQLTPLLCGSLAGEPLAKLLNRRESEVLQLVYQGLSNRQISQALCIAVTTVKDYRKRLHRKCKVNTAATLVRFALEKGLVA